MRSVKVPMLRTVMSLADLRGVFRLPPCLPAAGGSTVGTTGVLLPGLRAPALRAPDVGFEAGEFTPGSAEFASPDALPAFGAGAKAAGGPSTEDAPDLKYCHIASALPELIVSRNALCLLYKSSHIAMDLPHACET